MERFWRQTYSLMLGTQLLEVRSSHGKMNLKLKFSETNVAFLKE